MKDNLAALAAILVILGIFAGALLQPYFEARSFNRCTGSHAGYWDAVFTQLRIEGCRR